jgi:hypothetical protein
MQVKSLPQLQGSIEPWRDGRYRVYTVEHIEFDALPQYSDGGPAMIALGAYNVSYRTLDRMFSSAAVIAADDGMHVLSIFTTLYDADGMYAGSAKHELDGTRYPTQLDARRAAFEAGAIGFMVYERDVERLGLPAAA